MFALHRSDSFYGSVLAGQISQDDDVRKEELLNLDHNECLLQKSRLMLKSVLRGLLQ